jgi:purine nucleoside phosphorylase
VSEVAVASELTAAVVQVAVVSEVAASAQLTAAVVQVAEVAPSSTAAGNRRKHGLALAYAAFA